MYGHHVIDHFGINCADWERSKAFYDKVLGVLGFTRQMDFDVAIGYGVEGKPDFWIQQAESVLPMHFAFHCEQREPVDAFHRAAIGAGGKDNGKPGLRPEYHESYYGAFVLDPDGHNVEAVCHRPQ